MRKLDIDFNYQRRRSKWTGWALLLIGFALWGEMGVSYIRLQSEMNDLEKILVESGMTGKAARLKHTENYTAAEYERAKSIIAKIGIPWNDLFKAVETVKAERVALLALEPDPKSGKLVLRGEADDLSSVLTYVARLARTQQLYDVYLVQHEIKQGGNPAHPVAFSIIARWGALP